MSVSITVANLDDETFERLRAQAERQGREIEAVAGEILRDSLKALPDAEQTDDDRILAELAGTWTDEEAEAFLNAIADFDRIDDDLSK
ncbi:MAG: FitA-like ribbon-helix-helix domain-containing protein [Planctomycetaceae bacterium]